jgi:dihydrofolate synthase/folylpolyglutamate synthase
VFDRAALLALEHVGIKLGLDQIRRLLDALNHPEREFPCLVIAGTNGKGSVTAMVEHGLRAAGYRTGRYTSPHLVYLEERFAIDGVPIDGATCDRAIERVLRAATGMDAPPSFFEATTALALDVFREAHVDVAVLEVGLGGRLDATNAVSSRAVAITAVDFDHQEYLGYTLEEIAREKAGVIKPGGLTVLGENPPAVCRVVLEVAGSVGAHLVYAPEGVSLEARMEAGRLRAAIETPHDRYPSVLLGLRGRHQVANAITAIRLLEELRAGGHFDVGHGAVERALEDVCWPARLEMIETAGGQVLIDGAHNPAGARALASYVHEAFDRRLPFVIGAMRDKEIDAMIAALAPASIQFVCAAAASPRATSPSDLLDIVRRVAPAVPASAAASPTEALDRARAHGSPVIVAGSLYLAGEIREKLA